MLQGALERLLLKFLEPYVDGIDVKTLGVGIRGGSVDLRDLRFKKSASIGLQDFRIAGGRIKLIQMSLPWKQLLSQELRIVVQVVELELEHITSGAPRTDEELVEEMRRSKAELVEVRAQQLKDLLSHREADDGDAEGGGRAARVARKVVENLRVELSDIKVVVRSERQGFACCLNLPNLSVASADEVFRTAACRGVDAAKCAGALFKRLRLQQLEVQVAPAYSSDLSKSQRILSPIGIDLSVAHMPRLQTLRLRFELAAREHVGLRMLRTQCEHVLRTMAENSAEAERLERLWVPPATKQRILGVDYGKPAQETYRELFSRRLLSDKGLMGVVQSKPLSDQDRAKLTALEDVLPVLSLARQRMKVLQEVEKLEHQRSEREKEVANSKRGFFGRMFGRSAEASTAATAPLVTEEEAQQFLKAVQTSCEEVELPQNVDIEFAFGATILELVDDRASTRDDQRQVLRAVLDGLQVGIGMASKQDHYGSSSLDWRLEMRLLPLSAQQFGKHLVEVKDAHAGGGSAELEDFVAHLVIHNKLENQRNLLWIELQTLPLQLRWQPSFYTRILEFIRTPEDAVSETKAGDDGGADEAGVASGSRYDVMLDLSQQLLARYGDQAESAAAEVYKRLPDAMGIKVTLASPIFDVPVEGQGSATISLGCLKMQTPPEHCAAGSTELSFDLTDMHITATSLRGEHFGVLQPVPIHVTLKNTSSKRGTNVNIDVAVEQLKLTVAPQAYHIVMGVPGALAGGGGSSEAPAAGRAPGRSSSALEFDDEPPAPLPKPQLRRQLSRQLSRQASYRKSATRLMHDIMEGLEHEQGLKSAFNKAKGRVEQVAAMSLDVDVAVRAKRFQVTLLDSVTPVLRLHSRTDPTCKGIEVRYTTAPSLILTKMDKASLEVELLNPRHGVWEPLVEPFDFGMRFTQQPAEGQPNISDRDLELFGYGPLLLNASPSAVRTLGWFLPCFFAGPSQQDGPTSSGTAQQAVAGGQAPDQGSKYRVVNLCRETFVLRFHSPHKEDSARKAVPPTGSAWLPLDECVLRHFAHSVTIAVAGGSEGAPSMPLPLDRDAGTVEVPGLRHVFAELLTPHPSHRLLLLSSSLRVHNRTDLPLCLRCHADGEEAAFVPGLLDPTKVCSGALFGYAPLSCQATSSVRSGVVLGDKEVEASGGVVLGPNDICAVPLDALGLGGGGTAKAGLSVRLACAGGAGFCKPFFVEAADRDSGRLERRIESELVACPGAESDDDVSLVRYGFLYDSPLPVHARLTTVVLQPLLTLMNALPVLDLSFDLCAEGAGASRSVPVPCLQRVNVYRLPGDAAAALGVRLRLAEGAPWSGEVRFSREELCCAPRDVSAPQPQEVDVRMREGDGAALALLSHVGPHMLRAECPNWICDRSGRSESLEIRRSGRALPCMSGITLMPARCVEEPCELHYVEGGRSLASSKFCAPTGWSVLDLAYGLKSPLNLCLQADAIAGHDVLGAQCQVITLRPRLVLTNASDCDVEVRSGAAKVRTRANQGGTRIAGGASIEWHWARGDGSADETSLQFRPLDGAEWAWSPAIVCGDATVGSKALMLHGDGGGFTIWSADIASERSALAVSFRRGSAFVVANSAHQAGARLTLRPLGDGGAPAACVAVAAGEERCYGWATLQGGALALAEVRLETEGGAEERRISVQATTTQVFGRLGVVLSVRRKDDRSVVSLEDCDPAPGLAGGTSEVGSRLRVTLKLERLGVSLIEECPLPRELLYVQLRLIRMKLRKTERDEQTLELTIAGAQVDCQLPGRVDVTSRGGAGLDNHFGSVDKAAVLLANHSDDGRPFLSLEVKRVATSSRDFVLPSVSIDIDAVDVGADDEVLEHLGLFLAQSRNTLADNVGSLSAGGKALEGVLRASGKTILVDYVPSQVPAVVQMDSMKISAIDLTAWCRFALRNLTFLSPTFRAAFMLLSLGGEVSVEGARLVLDERLLPAHRGSAKEFVRGLVSAYTLELMSQLGNILGRSSLANIPRMPLRIAGWGLGATVGRGCNVVDETARWVVGLSGDEEYQRRRSETRDGRGISSTMGGFVRAGEEFSEGLAGMGDIFTKPVEGLQQHGASGFVVGLFRGATGTIAKPVAGAAHGVTSAIRGVAAGAGHYTGMSTTPQSRRRLERGRCRAPRLLYGERDVVRPYSELDAKVRQQVGREHIRGVEVVIPLAERAGGQGRAKAWLLYPTRLAVVELVAQVESRSTPSEQLLQQATRTSALIAGTFVDPLAIFGAFSQPVTDEPGDPRVLKSSLAFSKLRGQVLDLGATVQLSDHMGKLTVLPTQQARLGPEARKAFVTGLETALSKGVVDWSPLVAALQRQCDSVQATASIVSSSPSIAGGMQRCEVWEVQEWSMFSQSWQVAQPAWTSGHTDLGWRWVDAAYRKHPNLQVHTQEEASQSEMPPCSLHMFEPVGNWKPAIGSGTDDEGWTYSGHWTSDLWKPTASRFDSLRKRLWTRDFA